MKKAPRREPSSNSLKPRKLFAIKSNDCFVFLLFA